MEETKTSSEANGEAEVAKVERRSLILRRGPECLEVELLVSSTPLDSSRLPDWLVEQFAAASVALRVR